MYHSLRMISMARTPVSMPFSPCRLASKWTMVSTDRK